MSLEISKQHKNIAINLRSLKYSPSVNPLLEVQEIKLRSGLIRTGGYENLTNANGEVEAVSVIHRKKILDDANFVKMFAAGISASFELNRTSQRVLTAVLAAYQRTPLKGGFADWVELYWFGQGLEGQDLDMSEKTFQRGLKDLLQRKFLSPRTPTTFWTNPHLFFKGNRALFITEYQRNVESSPTQIPSSISDSDVPF